MSAEDVRADAGRTAGALRLVLAAIDAGDLEAEQDQRAYLFGAADALDSLAGVPREE